jgi:peptide chain release factor 2
VIEYDAKKKKLDELQAQLNAPDVWDTPDVAQKLGQQLSTLKLALSQVDSLRSGISNVEVYGEMIEELKMSGGAESEIVEMQKDCQTELDTLRKIADALEIQTLLNQKFDQRGAIISIRSGAGGVDAADWAEMLLRMYQRYFEQNQIPFKVDDISYSEEAGIKSATVEIDSPYAFGKLATEAGTHRLVRISPFNAQSKRQTSFAAVEVIPLIESTDEIAIPDTDIKIDVFRASGPGGQCVNTTDSAVRITHLPTNTVVSMQNEKSQIQNRAAAMRVLQSRLLLIKQAEEAAQKKELAGNITASWGDQIRNYVLHPYQMVKDLRTLVQTAQTAAVLNGDLEQFIDAGVRWRAKGAQ